LASFCQKIEIFPLIVYRINCNCYIETTPMLLRSIRFLIMFMCG